MQLPDQMPASSRYKGLNKLTKQHNTTTTAEMQLSDQMPASPRYTGLNKLTKRHNTTTTAGTRLSDRRSASSRYEGLNKLTKQHYTDTTPRPSGISRTFPARLDAPGTGRRLGNHPLVGRPHPVQQRRDQ